MKTFLTYLTFAALLALCYVERMNAEVARSQARGESRGHSPNRPMQHATVAQLRE